jgi:nucleoside-diphosphate-sugar epimerase
VPEVVLIIGCGYTGRRLIAPHLKRGDTVYGLVRTHESGAAVEAAGGRALIAEIGRDAAGLPAADRVYYCAPPPLSGTDDPGLATVLASLRDRPPACLVYLSTTGVYGDRRGAWVTERDAPAPGGDRGRRRLAAEQAVQAFGETTGCRVVILRVAAIYGPGRLPLDRLAAGRLLPHPDDCGVSNRIHVNDLAAACLAAADRGQTGAVYNAADGHPTSFTDYLRTLARLAGLPTPDIEPPGTPLDPGLAVFMKEQKRVDNTRLREELGVELRYPDAESGLAASLEIPDRQSTGSR